MMPPLHFPEIGKIITETLTKILGLAVPIIRGVCEAFIGLLKIFDIVDDEDNPEDLGAKAFQTEKKEDESFEEYFKRMKETEIDSEKSELHTEEEKIKKATEVVGNVVKEKFPNFDMDSFADYESKNPDYFTKDKMEELAKSTNAEENGGSELSEVIKIMNGEGTEEEKLDKAIVKLAEIEKKLDEELSDDEAKLNVIEARRE